MPAVAKRKPKPVKREENWKSRVEKFKREYLTPNDGSGEEEDGYWEVSGKYALFYCPKNDEGYPSQHYVLGWGNGCLLTLNTEFIMYGEMELLEHFQENAQKYDWKGRKTFVEFWEASEDEPRIDDIVVSKLPLYEYYEKHWDD